ncbi:retron Se72 family effector protein [Marinobacter changyiensis]|uniref:retron Se72 family effector protein n=1 Tax=Marinobacter changyiensis TaxID=2604091 RepID=UPI0012654781|nr:retron Se72 family effector protein [Marinobacter changyiensis]
MTDEKEHGTVRMFDPFKGFGFIRRETGKDVFVFFEDIKTKDRALVEGDKVRFDVKKEHKGPRAYDVEKTG